MANTTNYGIPLPQLGEPADIRVIDQGTEKIDNIMHGNRTMIAPGWVSTETYNTGNRVVYLGEYYKCKEDNVTGAWDATKWDKTTVGEDIEGLGTGGASALADLDDVEITSPTDGQALLFDDSDDKWKNGTLPDPSVTKEASGNPIEITDGADAPLVKCVTQITGSQDLHGYDKPWVGGANINKMPPGEAKSTSGYGVTITSDGNGTYTFVGTCTQDLEVTFDCDNFTIPSVDNSVLYLFNTEANANTVFVFYNNTTVVDTWSLTPVNRVSVYEGMKGSPCNKYGVRLKSGITYNLTIKPMIAVGTTYTTFTPYSNICPITAYTEGEIEVRGHNLWDEEVRNGYYNSTTGAYVSYSNCIANVNPIRVMPNTQYYSVSGSYTLIGYFYDADMGFITQTQINTGIFTTPNNCHYLNICNSYGQGSTYNNDISINYPSSATTYEPYTSTTHTTTYPSAIYRGSEDCVDGEVTEESRKVVFDGSNDESWSVSLQTNYIMFYITISDAVGFENAISNLFERISYAERGVKNGIVASSDNSLRVALLYDFGISDITGWRTWLSNNNVEVAYELATPTTSSVTPTNLPIKTLSGYTHIESTTGEMEVEYIRNTYQPIVDLIQSSSHVYSTAEQVVGKWIDGSTVYERTFTGLSVNTDGVNWVHISSIDTTNWGEVLDCKIYRTTNNKYASIPIAEYSCRIQNIEDLAVSVISSSFDSTITMAIVRYTKSTTTRSLSAPVNAQKSISEPLTDKTEEVPTEEEKTAEKPVEEPEKEEPVEMPETEEENDER